MRHAFTALLLLAAACSSPAPKAPEPPRPDSDGMVRIKATEEGFEPSKVEAKAGVPLKLEFTRIAERTCMTGVVFPDLGIDKDLPLNTPVLVEVTPQAGGTIHFQCPMAMGKGTIVTLPGS